MGDIRKIVDSPIKLKNYHGQMTHIQDVRKVDAKVYDTQTFRSPLKDAVADLAAMLGLTGLYQHQGEVVQTVFDGKDAFLSLDEGSGSTMSADIVAILVGLLKHQTVLYLRPFGRELGPRTELLRNRVAKTHWDWILKAESADGPEGFAGLLPQVPDVIVTTPEAVMDYVLTWFPTEKQNIWFDSLGLVVVEDVTSFNPEELCHLKHLLSAVSFRQREPARFLLCGKKVGSPEAFAGEVVGRPVAVSTTDHSAKRSYSLSAWVPALLSHPCDDGTLRVWREKYTKELKDCLVTLCRANDNVLLWHQLGSLSAAAERGIREAAVHEVEGEIPNIKFTVHDDIRDVPKDAFGRFTKVFVIGFTNQQGNLKAMLGNLLADDGMAVLIPIEDPYSFSVVREPAILDDQGLWPRILPLSSDSVKRRYLVKAIAAYPDPAVSLEKTATIWGRDFTLPVLAELETKGLVRVEAGKVVIVDRAAITALETELPWGVVDARWFTLQLPERGAPRTLRISKALFPHVVFPEALYFRGADKYVISSELRPDSGTVGFRIALDNDPVLKVPVLAHQLDEGGAKPVSKECRGFGRIELITGVVVRVSLTGTKAFASFEEGEAAPPVAVGPFETRATTTVVRFTPENASSDEVLPIFRMLFPVHFRDAARLFDLFESGGSICIAPVFPESDELMKLMYEWLSSFLLKWVYEHGYNLLRSCPCAQGCPLCLRAKTLPDEAAPDKATVMLTLARALGKEAEAQVLIQYKTRGMEDESSSLRMYSKTVSRVLDVFRDKLDTAIAVPARLEVRKLKKYAGFCDGEVVVVVPGCAEAGAVGLLAHEYGHDWQFDGNVGPGLGDKRTVPFDGKLVIEGFAEWVEFKTLDFFGLADNMVTPLDLRGRDENYKGDEYSLGFVLMRYIEERVAGFYGVRDFMTTAKVSNLETKVEYDLDRLLTESGVRDKLPKPGAEAKEPD